MTNMTNRNKIFDSFGSNLSLVLFSIYFSKYIPVDLHSVIPIMTISKGPPNTVVNRKIMISMSSSPVVLGGKMALIHSALSCNYPPRIRCFVRDNIEYA